MDHARIVVNMTPKKRWTGVTEGEEERGGGVEINRLWNSILSQTSTFIEADGREKEDGDHEGTLRDDHEDLFWLYLFGSSDPDMRDPVRKWCACAWPELFYCRLSSALHHLYSCYSPLLYTSSFSIAMCTALYSVFSSAPPPFLSSWPVDPQTNEQDSHFLHSMQCFSPWKLFYILHPISFSQFNAILFFWNLYVLLQTSVQCTTALGDLLWRKNYFLTTKKT